MIYAKAHDQTVADDYFAAMGRVEERLDFSPPKQEIDAVVNVPETAQIMGWIDLLALPELGQDERVEVVERLKEALFPGIPVPQHPPPVMANVGM